MNNLKELKIWQKAIDLSVEVDKVTSHFSSERFGLTSQSRRAAVSISSNIAEGAGRTSPKEFNLSSFAMSQVSYLTSHISYLTSHIS